MCDDIRSPGTYKRLAQVACRSLDEDYVDGGAIGGVTNDAEDGESSQHRLLSYTCRSQYVSMMLCTIV